MLAANQYTCPSYITCEIRPHITTTHRLRPCWDELLHHLDREEKDDELETTIFGEEEASDICAHTVAGDS